MAGFQMGPPFGLNRNLEMLAFVVGGEPKNPEKKKTLEEGENNQKTQHIWHHQAGIEPGPQRLPSLPPVYVSLGNKMHLDINEGFREFILMYLEWTSFDHEQRCEKFITNDCSKCWILMANTS